MYVIYDIINKKFLFDYHSKPKWTEDINKARTFSNISHIKTHVLCKKYTNIIDLVVQPVHLVCVPGTQKLEEIVIEKQLKELKKKYPSI